MLISAIRVPLRASLSVLWILVMLPFVMLFWALGFHRVRSRFLQLYFKGSLRILAVHYRLKGMLHDARPLLLLSNHASYVDTFILGAITPVAFTPKREVRSWPVIGWLCMLAGCVFVERRPTQMHEARAEMAKRLEKGQVLCIFPEGTTSDSTEVKPFKSGFVSLAEDHGIPVQPVTISYVALEGKPISAEKRRHVAWVGADTFFVHFLRLLRYQSVDAVVEFHAVQRIEDFADRKALSKQCEEMVRAGLMLSDEMPA